MTTVLLVSSHDRTEYIGELTFTSEDAAHLWMSSEMSEQVYCFVGEEQTMFEPNPYVLDTSYVINAGRILPAN